MLFIIPPLRDGSESSSLQVFMDILLEENGLKMSSILNSFTIKLVFKIILSGSGSLELLFLALFVIVSKLVLAILVFGFKDSWEILQNFILFTREIGSAYFNEFLCTSSLFDLYFL